MSCRIAGALALLCGTFSTAEESTFLSLQSGAGFKLESGWREAPPDLKLSFQRSLGCEFVEAWSKSSKSTKKSKPSGGLFVCGYYPVAVPYSSRLVFDGAQLNNRLTDLDDICACIRKLLENFDEHPGKVEYLSRKFLSTPVPGRTEVVASMRWTRGVDKARTGVSVRAIFDRGHCYLAVGINLGSSKKSASILNSMIGSFRLPI